MKKLALLIIFPLLLTGCGNKQITVEDDGYAIVDPLKTGDDYKVKEFEEAFKKTSHYLLSSYSYQTGDYINFMPHNIFDKYNLGAYRVSSANKDNVYYHYYLYHDNNVYMLPGHGNGDEANNHGFIQFLISDINSDGNIEVTTSFNRIDRLCFSYLSTLDTKYQKVITANYNNFDNYFTFNKDEEGLAIYTNKFVNGALSKEKSLYSLIKPYNRVFKLNAPEYKITNDLYQVTVTMDEKEENAFSLIYQGMTIRHNINVEMMYLGPEFTYTNPDTYQDGALTVFKKDEYVLKMEGWDAGLAITTFHINKFDIISRTYAYYDTYDEYNPSGAYDMFVSYRGEGEEVEICALSVRE